MLACDFGSLCDTIRIWKQGSGFRDFVREKKILFLVLSSVEYRIYVKAVLFPWEKKNIIRMTV